MRPTTHLGCCRLKTDTASQRGVVNYICWRHGWLTIWQAKGFGLGLEHTDLNRYDPAVSQITFEGARVVDSLEVKPHKEAIVDCIDYLLRVSKVGMGR